MASRLTAMVAVGAALTLGAHAQLSLSSVVDLALRNDPKMRMAQADVEKARAQVSATHDAFIPGASVSGGYGTSVGVPLGVPVVFSISSQSLLFNFSQQDNIRAANSGLRAAELAAQDMHDKVAEDAVVSYLNLDSAEHRQAAMTQEYGYANRLVTIVQERLDAGQDTKMELLKSKRTAAQIKLAQLRLADEIANLSDHLARLVGVRANALQTVPESIPALPSLDAPVGIEPDSFAVRSAFSIARSKQETSFGENRYRFRPQVSFAANYSRISTSHTDYTEYYVGFSAKSENAVSIGLQIQIPILDFGHQAHAREAAAEAKRARFEAEDARNQFLEGRFKLRNATAELSARSEIAGLDRDLAQEQLDAVLVQLSADNAATGGVQLTPKDEQNARLQERQRFIDLLDAQFQLNQAQVNLMRQSGALDGWLRNATGTGLSGAPVAPKQP